MNTKLYKSRKKNRSVKDEVKTIKLAGFIEESMVDGPGIRFAVFVQGCPHICPSCHNPETHNFNAGTEVDIAKLAEKIINSKCTGVTFSGGEPFCQATELARLARLIRKQKRKMQIFTYTGYEYHDLLDMCDEDDGIFDLLCETNYLVDGRFVETECDYSKFYRGSRNQKIYDVTCFPNSANAREIISKEEFKTS